ncbi:proline iminopeptidase [Glycocaulis alkaliphilus]|uniref:Proline iminopeptidase n=1 Tax=Glycocaulis alkaliphilus TaxID=1434191 RepID=A0A3T0ECM5_9PROT|nr:alpha/beta fold hydrolase [Glycocaulis alkaliphilus]AZU05052.1 proline iminopeptidase [Glycocaulis alkaliphilus]GGB65626.1 proline iminopeptidase [Glycocaulis alkaliphilus]
MHSALFPDIAAREAGLLPVSDGHSLYWERSGLEGGRALLFLHGGPGSGASARHRRYADPAIWETIQFDQRGCGRSAPLFELYANTTAHLIEDVEALREHLGLERFDCVMGASWGTTLALAYAQAHPERVENVLVEGVFLATRRELDWWHGKSGAGAVYPDAHGWLMHGVPEALHDDPPGFARWALAAMQTELAAGAPLLAKLDDPDAEAALKDSVIFRWIAYEELLSHLEATPQSALVNLRAKGRDKLISTALIEAHYFSQGCFLEEGQLLTEAYRLTMPVHIVHSRYDMVCPLQSAFDLKDAAPDATLTIVPAHGHAMSEPVFKVVRNVIAGL